MELLRSVDAHAHQESVFAEEAAPLGREQRAVGLQAVVDVPAAGIVALQFERTAVEGEGTHQCLTAVPGEEHLRAGLCLDVFLDELFEQFVAQHVLPRVGIQLLLL